MKFAQSRLRIGGEPRDTETVKRGYRWCGREGALRLPPIPIFGGVVLNQWHKEKQ